MIDPHQRHAGLSAVWCSTVANQACACACGEHIRDRPNEEGGQDVIGHHTLPDVETAEVIRQERTDYEDFARIKAPRQVEYARHIPAQPDQRIQ